MSVYVKLGLSEKHTKFEKNLPRGFDKSADLLSKRQNNEEDFFQIMCPSLNFNVLFQCQITPANCIDVNTLYTY